MNKPTVFDRITEDHKLIAFGRAKEWIEKMERDELRGPHKDETVGIDRIEFERFIEDVKTVLK